MSTDSGSRDFRKLHVLITQNVDGLHQRAGSSPDKEIGVHGTILDVMCA